MNTTTEAELEVSIHSSEFQELRLDVLFHADDGWKHVIVTRAMQELRQEIDESDENVVSTLTENNVWVESREEHLVFCTNQPHDKVLDNEYVLQRLPMSVINSSVWESDSYSQTRTLAQILYDSGKQLGEIEQILGTELTEEIELVI